MSENVSNELRNKVSECVSRHEFFKGALPELKDILEISATVCCRFKGYSNCNNMRELIHIWMIDMDMKYKKKTYKDCFPFPVEYHDIDTVNMILQHANGNSGILKDFEWNEDTWTYLVDKLEEYSHWFISGCMTDITVKAIRNGMKFTESKRQSLNRIVIKFTPSDGVILYDEIYSDSLLDIFLYKNLSRSIIIDTENAKECYKRILDKMKDNWESILVVRNPTPMLRSIAFNGLRSS